MHINYKQRLYHKNYATKIVSHIFFNIYCIYAVFFVPLQANSFLAKNAYKIYTITQ